MLMVEGSWRPAPDSVLEDDGANRGMVFARVNTSPRRQGENA
jgi:hypothetical protein